MFIEGVLNFSGADLVAAGLDDVRRDPAYDADVAVVFLDGRVPGGEPAVPECLLRRVGPVEVLEEEIRAADVDLVVLDLQLDAGQRRADGAGAALAVGADRGVHQRLAHAVALDDLL